MKGLSSAGYSGIRGLCKHLVWISDFSHDKVSQLACCLHNRKGLAGLKWPFKSDVPNKQSERLITKQLRMTPPHTTSTIQSQVSPKT